MIEYQIVRHNLQSFGEEKFRIDEWASRNVKALRIHAKRSGRFMELMDLIFIREELRECILLHDGYRQESFSVDSIEASSVNEPEGELYIKLSEYGKAGEPDLITEITLHADK